MKNLIKYVFAFALSAITCAHASTWELYDSFMKLHYTDGKIVDFDEKGNPFTTSEGQSYAMFFALVQKDKNRFDKLLNFVEKELCEGSFEKKLPAWKWAGGKVVDSNNATDSDMFIAYNLFNAADIFNEQSYKTKALAILSNIKKNCIAKNNVLGSVILPGTYGFNANGEIKLNPSYFPPFVMQKLSSYDDDFKVYYQNVLNAIARGSEAGFAPDWIVLNQDGNILSSKANFGSYEAIRVYLWLGITAKTDPNRRLMIPLYQNMLKKVKNEHYVPEKVNLNTLETTGKGNVGFEASLIALADEKIKDLFRTRVKNHVFGKREYYSHALCLFATGFDEHRYEFTQNGSLLLGK